MAKTVMIEGSDVRHLNASKSQHSPLCAATYPNLKKGKRRSVSGDVTCTRCKTTLKAAVENALA